MRSTQLSAFLLSTTLGALGALDALVAGCVLEVLLEGGAPAAAV
jgi:hypothetical protein